MTIGDTRHPGAALDFSHASLFCKGKGAPLTHVGEVDPGGDALAQHLGPR